MSGTKYLLDTNAVISIVNDNQKLLSLIDNADFVAFSIVSIIEFLSYSNLSQKDEEVFKKMIMEASVIDLSFQDHLLIGSVTEIRKTYRLKLPDAILEATALTYDLHLLTNDKEFNKTTSLSITNF